ncbi:hypothetical protein ACWEFJ_28275 [Actinosynnema sp. NPDC004786]
MTDLELIASLNDALDRHTEFEREHQRLLDALTAVGQMPGGTNEEQVARFTRRAEVQNALADLYAAKRALIDATTMFGWTLGIAEQKYRDGAYESGLRADRARARIARAAGGAR